MSANNEPEIVEWEGRFVMAKRRGKWEYVSRTRDIHAAAILAVHEGEVILVEQYRVPLQAMCLELPAGLIGDERRDPDGHDGIAGGAGQEDQGCDVGLVDRIDEPPQATESSC